MDSVRLCVCCRHFYLWPGCLDYSEVTPGEPPEAGCCKDLASFVFETDKFRAAIATAATCPEFTLPEEIESVSPEHIPLPWEADR